MSGFVNAAEYFNTKPKFCRTIYMDKILAEYAYKEGVKQEDRWINAERLEHLSTEQLIEEYDTVVGDD